MLFQLQAWFSSDSESETWDRLFSKRRSNILYSETVLVLKQGCGPIWGHLTNRPFAVAIDLFPRDTVSIFPRHPIAQFLFPCQLQAFSWRFPLDALYSLQNMNVNQNTRAVFVTSLRWYSDVQISVVQLTDVGFQISVHQDDPWHCKLF